MAQVAQGPSGSTTPSVSLACPPRFVGQQLGPSPSWTWNGDGDLDLAVADFREAITTAFNQGGDFEAAGTYPLRRRRLEVLGREQDHLRSRPRERAAEVTDASTGGPPWGPAARA